MTYTTMTEEQLILSFRGGDKAAGEELLVRYKNKVLSIARRFFLVGGDTDDLVQEGMCGLYSAMTSFEGNSGFPAYAYACIKNRILDAVKKSESSKNAALNGSSPISAADSKADCINPEEMLIDDENECETAQKMQSVLSDLEYKVIRMYVDGATMSEIVSSLRLTYKQADNAIMRAKNKLRALYAIG